MTYWAPCCPALGTTSGTDVLGTMLSCTGDHVGDHDVLGTMLSCTGDRIRDHDVLGTMLNGTGRVCPTSM